MKAGTIRVPVGQDRRRLVRKKAPACPKRDWVCRFTPLIPAGAQAGDIAVLIVAGRPSDDSMPSPPAGWSLRSASLRQLNGRDLRLITYYRVLAAANTHPSLSLPAEWRNNGGMSGQIAVWSGVDNTNPFDVADVTGTAGATQSWTPPGLNTAST